MIDVNHVILQKYFGVIDLKSGLKSRDEHTSTSLRQLFNDGVEDSSVADPISLPSTY